MSDVKTVGGFEHPTIHWSMINSDSFEAFYDVVKAEGNNTNEYWRSPEGKERWRVAYDAQVLELDTTAPDGIHLFRVGYYGEVQWFYGIVVEDGKFDPVLTAHAIHIAMFSKKTGIDLHHRFIEGIDWVTAEEDPALVVDTHAIGYDPYIDAVKAPGYFKVSLGS